MKRKRMKNCNRHNKLFDVVCLHMYISSYRYVSVVSCLFFIFWRGYFAYLTRFVIRSTGGTRLGLYFHSEMSALIVADCHLCSIGTAKPGL